MSTETLRYDKMVESALRGVVRAALTEVATVGELPGDHHFYITFRTDFPGVQVPAFLKAQYPDEITIVLQYQFYALEVADSSFSVTLSFNGVQERLVVPLAAVTTFADPAVNFALQFQTLDEIVESADAESDEEEGDETSDEKENGADSQKMGQVVALDAFRKK